jgi:hypothetical protein
VGGVTAVALVLTLPPVLVYLVLCYTDETGPYASRRHSGPGYPLEGGRKVMTLLWFIIWIIANNVGAHKPLLFDPVNLWAGTLILAVALDLSAPHASRAARNQ